MIVYNHFNMFFIYFNTPLEMYFLRKIRKHIKIENVFNLEIINNFKYNFKVMYRKPKWRFVKSKMLCSYTALKGYKFICIRKTIYEEFEVITL